MLFLGFPMVVAFAMLGIIGGIMLGFLDIMIDVVLTLEKGFEAIYDRPKSL